MRHHYDPEDHSERVVPEKPSWSAYRWEEAENEPIGPVGGLDRQACTWLHCCSKGTKEAGAPWPFLLGPMTGLHPLRLPVTPRSRGLIDSCPRKRVVFLHARYRAGQKVMANAHTATEATGETDGACSMKRSGYE